MGESSNTIEEKKIESVQDLLTFVKEVRKAKVKMTWWRGQENAEFDLIPRVYRKESNGKKFDETNLLHIFKARARSRSDSCPDDSPSKKGDWLALAQHYRLPTRLLDWSESALTGLFFALLDGNDVEGSASIDGALWVLSPMELNKQIINDNSIHGWGGEPIVPIVNAAFDRNLTPSDLILPVHNSHFWRRNFVRMKEDRFVIRPRGDGG